MQLRDSNVRRYSSSGGHCDYIGASVLISFAVATSPLVVIKLFFLRYVSYKYTSTPGPGEYENHMVPACMKRSPSFTNGQKRPPKGIGYVLKTPAPGFYRGKRPKTMS